jgi:nitrite reductase/ring-hydroxylating ferredoxin subunit
LANLRSFGSVEHIALACAQFISGAPDSFEGLIEMSEGYVKVGRVTDFPAGSLKKVAVGVDEVIVTTVGGKLYAITNKCTHRGGPLNEGELEGSTIICPWHGGKFDLTTGKVVSPPPMKDEASFTVKIEGSDVLLKKM